MSCPICGLKIEVSRNTYQNDCPQKVQWDLCYMTHYRYDSLDLFVAIKIPPYQIIQHLKTNKTEIEIWDFTPKSRFPPWKTIWAGDLVSDSEAIELLERLKKLEAFL